jgi:hypothetical protein
LVPLQAQVPVMTTTCPACAPLAAEVAELRGIFQAFIQTLGVVLERTGTPLVSADEARAILTAEYGPLRVVAGGER